MCYHQGSCLSLRLILRRVCQVCGFVIVVSSPTVPRVIKEDEAEVDVTRISSFWKVKSLRDRSYVLEKQGSIPCSTMTSEPERGVAMETANAYETIENKG